MNPLAVSMLLGFFLLSGGLAKVIGAVTERTTGWGWFAFNGAISLILGGLLLSTFPYSSKWTLGAFIGVDLIFAGASLIGLGITIRNARKDVIADLRSMLPETPGEADRKRHGSDHDPESSPHLH
ncbi:acid-resistance membrane protein [compost metagenome]